MAGNRYSFGSIAEEVKEPGPLHQATSHEFPRILEVLLVSALDLG